MAGLRIEEEVMGQVEDAMAEAALGAKAAREDWDFGENVAQEFAADIHRQGHELDAYEAGYVWQVGELVARHQ